MSEHNTLTDPYLHEPKGVASAASGTAYIADGAGSGSWTPMKTASELTAQLSNMQIVNGASSKSLAAVDTSVAANYIKYDVDWSAGVEEGTEVTYGVDKITISATGTYKVSFWSAVQISSGVGNSFFAIAISTDDATTGIAPKKIVAQSDFSGDIRNVSAMEHINLTSGDVLSIWVAAEAAVTMSMLSATLSVEKVL